MDTLGRFRIFVSLYLFLYADGITLVSFRIWSHLVMKHDLLVGEKQGRVRIKALLLTRDSYSYFLFLIALEGTLSLLNSVGMLQSSRQ